MGGEKMVNIVLCIPGSNFSREFVMNLVRFVGEAIQLNIQIQLSMQYDAVVHFARAKCLGANVLAGKNQRPFSNSTDYDFIMWIDSDIIFQTNQIIQLLRHFHDKPSLEVVSGWYSMADGKSTTMVRKWDYEYYKKHASFEFTTNEEMSKMTELVDCEYIGMGFMMMRRQVFEKLEYPWFYEPLQEINENVRDMCSEDVAFCKKLNRSGIKIWVDPKIRVGHQKLLTI